MVLATGRLAPPDVSYVLVAPAVWGRARMNFVLVGHAVAGGRIWCRRWCWRGRRCGSMASDNRAALIRLSTDPLTIRHTRVDTLDGLVDLMDAALAAAPQMRAPALFLYGGHDELVPKAATAATWRALPRGGAGARMAYYPAGYHLLLRDHERACRSATSWRGSPIRMRRCRPGRTSLPRRGWSGRTDGPGRWQSLIRGFALDAPRAGALEPTRSRRAAWGAGAAPGFAVWEIRLDP